MLVLAAEFQYSWLWLAEVLVFVALYGVLASSLNLVTGTAGMFSLGHHGFYAVGAYAAAWVTTVAGRLEPGSWAAWGVFLASGVVAALAAAAAGVLVGLPCLRLRGDYLAIATLAFGEILRIAIENTDPETLGGSLGLYVPRLVMDATGHVEEYRTLFVVLGAVLLLGTVVVLRNVVASAHGRAIVSIREDEVATELLGVRTTRHKMRAFVIGAAFAGLAGWFYAHYSGSIAPKNFDLMVGIKILLIAVLGGLGSISGTVVAAVLLIGLERLLQTGVFGETLKEWMQVEYALLLILLMLVRPNGLFGRRELVDLFRRRPAGKEPRP